MLEIDGRPVAVLFVPVREPGRNDELGNRVVEIELRAAPEVL